MLIRKLAPAPQFLILVSCESEISVRIQYRTELGVVVYMFSTDCHVGVAIVYVL